MPADSRAVGRAEIAEASDPRCVCKADHVVREHVVPGVSVILRHIGGRSESPEGYAVDMISLRGQGLLHPGRIETGLGRQDDPVSRPVLLIMQADSVRHLYASHRFPSVSCQISPMANRLSFPSPHTYGLESYR